MSVRLGTTVYTLSQLAAPILLIIFGLLALVAVGFAPGTILHEFVHDGRHLLGFPCD